MKQKFVIKALVATLMLLSLALCSETLFAGNSGDQNALWQKVAASSIRAKGRRSLFPKKYETVRLNQKLLESAMSAMPVEFSAAAGDKRVIIDIPMPDGELVRFRIERSEVLAEHLAAAFPSWRTFQGYGVNDPTLRAQFDWTNFGFHGYIFTPNGTVYIDPIQDNDTENYLVYYKHDYTETEGSFSCKAEDSLVSMLLPEAASSPDSPAYAYGTALRTYRLAIATTGQWARGTTTSTDPQTIRTAALAAMTTSVNRLNGIFRREIASTFQLVNPPITDNARNIIFDDPATAPYDNTDSTAQLTLNQTTIDARVGSPNYDVGHLYGTGGGGVASAPSICDAMDKAQGYSARAGFYGDPFTVDYVAHEIGHQFGASHTYNNMDQGGACTTRSTSNAFEVASGSTLMSYVGICNIRNLQQYVDSGTPMFHIRSLTQMTTYLATPAGTCGATSGTNAIPTINAGASFTIPRLTPFTLTATGGDADAADVANLLYSWEEYDLAPSGSGQLGTPALSYDVDTDGILRPLFRAYSPVASPSRTFPSLAFILNPANNNPAGSNNPPLQYQGTHPTGALGATCQAGNDCVIGESLPSQARTMNFRVAIRDQNGGIADAGTAVTTAASTGPFQVTTQNTAPVAWAPGTQTVTWDVAGTVAPPINAANVKISLSTDGGQTFTTLLASTPNDGTEPITVPSVATMQARIKVEAVGNIFFDINNADFQITGAGDRTPTPTPTPPGIGIGDARGPESGAAPALTNAPTNNTFDFVVTRTGNINVVSTVHYATVDGTATTSGHDYEPTLGDLTFAVGETTKDVYVVIDTDDKIEPDVTFTVHLSAPTGAIITDADGVGTIIKHHLAACGTAPTIYAYNFNNDHLLGFSSSAPGTIVSDIQLTGINPGESLTGLDFRPANGLLYSVASDGTTNRVVTINTTTGAVTAVGGTTPATTDIFFGTDFNPVVDRIRIVGDARSNRRLNPDTGALVATDTPLAYAAGDPGAPANPHIVHIAYDRNVAGATLTTLFGIDDTRDTLVRIGGVDGNPSPNGGQVTTVGPLGFNVSSSGGFDIQGGSGTAYAVMRILGVSTLFTINLATGAATQMGAVGGGPFVDGIALAACTNVTSATVSGRAVTSDGRGLRNSTVSITDSQGVTQTTTTSSFGLFSFDNVPTGNTYTVRIVSRLFRFQSQTVLVSGNMTLADFVGLE